MTTRSPLVVVATLLAAASMLVFGFWALFSPRAFLDFVNYPPYNEHLIHDAGAFQIGIGAGLLFALIWADSLVVALSAFVVGSGLHTFTHYMDSHLGGHGTDVPQLGLLTLVAVVAIVFRVRKESRR